LLAESYETVNHSHDRTTEADILFNEVAWNSGHYKFHSYALCCKVSCHDLLTNILSLQLVL